jgi:hypothetical protein
MRTRDINELGSGRNEVKAMSVTPVEDSNPSTTIYGAGAASVCEQIPLTTNTPPNNELGSGRNKMKAMLTPTKEEINKQ